MKRMNLFVTSNKRHSESLFITVNVLEIISFFLDVKMDKSLKWLKREEGIYIYKVSH